MKRRKKSKSYTKIGMGLLILILAAAGIIWQASREPATSTEEVAQSYLDFILQGDEQGANQLTGIAAGCSPPGPYMQTEIASQTAIFAQTEIRNLTIETQSAGDVGYPSEAEAADIRFEFQTDGSATWLPAHLWVVTMPNAQNGPDRAICHLGGSSLLIPE